MFTKKTILLSLFSSCLLFGSNIKEIDNNTIIIYNNLALINNKGEIKVDKDKSELSIPNISTNIIKDSVSISFNNKNINILEQNYKYDIFNFYSILKFNLNKEVLFENNPYTLISSKGDCIIHSNIENTVSKVSCDKLTFKNLPNDILFEPSLNWTLYNKSNSNIDTNFELSYLSNGFNWTSNYVANIKDNKILLNGWINLSNNSDTNLNNYSLILLSGKPNVIEENQIQPRTFNKANVIMENVYSVGVKEESFSDYHIYKIPFKVNIPKQSSKQISFIDKTIEKFDIEYKIDLHSFNTQEKLKFNKTISFDNDLKNGLGIPLPNGKIRFYEKDKENINYFIGENKIDNTPINENIKLEIGQDFNSILDTKLIEYVHNDKKQLFKIEYTIKNNSNENKTYIIKQFNPISNVEKKNIEINTTCKNNCSYTFENTQYITYKLNIKKGSEFKFTTSLED